MNASVYGIGQDFHHSRQLIPRRRERRHQDDHIADRAEQEPSTARFHGDIHRALNYAQYAVAEMAGELGDVLAGRCPGRTSEAQITIAKFVGIGAQDLVTAEVCVRRLQGMGSPSTLDAHGANAG